MAMMSSKVNNTKVVDGPVVGQVVDGPVVGQVVDGDKPIISQFKTTINNIFGNIDLPNNQYYKIYGYMLNPNKHVEYNYGILGRGEVSFTKDRNLLIKSSISYYNDVTSEINNYDQQQVFLPNSTNSLVRNFIGDDLSSIFQEQMVISENYSNMIELANSDLTKIIQIICGDESVGIFYIKEGAIIRYEEYHPIQNDHTMDYQLSNEEKLIAKTITNNLIKKYSIKELNQKSNENINIDDNQNSDESDISDTEREMRELGIFNEAEAESDSDSDSDSASDFEENNSSDLNTESSDEEEEKINIQSPLISSSESNIDSESNSSDSEIDEDLQRILMG